MRLFRSRHWTFDRPVGSFAHKDEHPDEALRYRFLSTVLRKRLCQRCLFAWRRVKLSLRRKAPLE